MHNFSWVFLDFQGSESILYNAGYWDVCSVFGSRSHGEPSWGRVYEKQQCCLILCMTDKCSLTEPFSWMGEGHYCVWLNLTKVLEFICLSLLWCYYLLFHYFMQLIKRVVRTNKLIRLFVFFQCFHWYQLHLKTDKETWLRCVIGLHCKKLKNE